MSLPFSDMDLAAAAVLDDVFETLTDREATSLHGLMYSKPAKADRDDSADDFQLCRLLALGTRKPALIEYVARSTERVRPKWDTKRGPQHTYLTYTIEKALANTGAEYEKRWSALDTDAMEPVRA